MTARQLFPTGQPSLPLRVFSEPDEPSDVRIVYPHVQKPVPSGPGIVRPETLNPDVMAAFALMREANQKDVPRLDESTRQAARLWTLAEFYDQALSGWRHRQLDRKEVSQGTLQKERQSLACFSEWDKRQQPPNWPSGNIWRGLPVSFLSAHYFEQWAIERLNGGLAIGSVEGRWCQLRTILNWLVKLRVIDQSPACNLAPAIERHRQAAIDRGDLDEDDFTPTAYTDSQLSAVYAGLSGRLDMQTAWVLGANSGPRTVDLFGLRWGINVRLDAETPEMFYKAKKTGKRHWVPLAPVCVAHLKRLVHSQGHLDPLAPGGLVFPHLTAGSCSDSEKSHAARARNAVIKSVLASCRISEANPKDYAKPWQVLRATANSRLNNHSPGVGLIVTHGKEANVGNAHYWNEKPLITKAVMELKQPDAFWTVES